MGDNPPKPSRSAEDASHTDARLKIYFLPNLLTGANLFCGFVALTKIVKWDIAGEDYKDIKVALLFILAILFYAYMHLPGFLKNLIKRPFKSKDSKSSQRA